MLRFFCRGQFMQHFLDIESLSTQDITALLNRALWFKQKNFPYPPVHSPGLVNLFYENSTRTRVSFELAAKYLSIPVINFSLSNASLSKGETIEDTITNLVAMGINLFVIRHSENFFAANIANHIGNAAHIINAGDGTHAHPSQALLDLMTIYEKKPVLSDLKIAIVGNIKHSRVANSLQVLFKKVGVKQLKLIAPPIWQTEKAHFGHITDSMKEGLQDADVVICLRVQKERLLENECLDYSTYRKDFALTPSTLCFAHPQALVLHPGPLNRGLEIDSLVADGAQSCILQQVKNGVLMRMAIIESLLGMS